MNKLFTKIRDKHSLWYKAIIFALAVISTVYLLPQNTNYFLQNIAVNDVWTKEALIANTDFLIKKADDAKIATSTQQNYYQKQSVATVAITNALPTNAHKTAIINLLDSIYGVGVYNTSMHDSVFFVIENNEVVASSKNKLISVLLARQLIKNTINNEVAFNQISKLITPNVVLDETITQQLKSETKNVPTSIYKLKVKKGETLVFKNDIITEDVFEKLHSYNDELTANTTSANKLLNRLGYAIICIVLFGIVMLFLLFFRKNIFSQSSHVTFILLVMMLIILTASLVHHYNTTYLFAVPFCLIPVLIRVFFDSRTALFSFLVVVLLASFFSYDKFEFVFVQLTSGIGVIFSVVDVSKRSRLFITALLAFMFYLITYCGYHLANNTALHLQNTLVYICLLVSSMCMLFAFPLIFLFEKMFDFVSDFTLLELCDLNQPLLRTLSQKIPGTFQHSLQVANLAEEACFKIGGNALLVRTGAMYHDIGKMNNPRYFTENQVGDVSPHADMSSQESAKIIINHVLSGVEIAKQHNLPETIIDFIRTHHGTTTTRFFLHNYKKEHQGEIINEDLFRYPGPIPFSKETAILMMADSVEASSRSLKKYDAVTIDELVDKIMDHQINENQFLNADITFKDINQIKKIFKKRLMNIYHVRIEYPR